MDKYRIDSHKLMYHPQRVADWLEGKPIYPIYVELSPSGTCNHRCVFCAFDYVGYKKKFMNIPLLKERLFEMARLGVKSVLYSGEGEPFLNPHLGEVIQFTKKVGIDAAVATNGVLFKEEIAKAVLGSITWLKVSINAGTKETYSRIHRANKNDFDRVIQNMSYAARVREAKGYRCTLGMQLLLLPENYNEVFILAKIAKDIGMDYLVVKPYSQHRLSNTKQYQDIHYGKYSHLAEELGSLNDEKFNVVVRLYTMKKLDDVNRSYKHCYAFSFWAHIDASGNVWGCPAYLGIKKFLYGNIFKDTFRDIWQGKKRKEIVGFAETKLNIKKCRVNCRMDEINRYLWELKHPPEHINFI